MAQVNGDSIVFKERSGTACGETSGGVVRCGAWQTYRYQLALQAAAATLRHERLACHRMQLGNACGRHSLGCEYHPLAPSHDLMLLRWRKRFGKNCRRRCYICRRDSSCPPHCRVGALAGVALAGQGFILLRGLGCCRQVSGNVLLAVEGHSK